MKDTELEKLFEKVYEINNISIDDLVIKYFDCIDEIAKFIIYISSKGGLLNESQEGQINTTKVKKLNEEAQRIINRIEEHIKNGDKPHPGQTNELIDCLNLDDIPKSVRLMMKVFRNKPKNGVRIYDSEDKDNMYNVCLVYKNTIDALRELLNNLDGDYDLPKEFNLPYNNGEKGE